jgi:5-methylcytosine-specific restriction endonuclease McrA
MRCSKQRERNPAWRGGVTNISELIRKSDKYLFWRRKILIRDSYCCTECGNSNNLEVHHKISLRKIIKRFKLKTLDEAYSCKFLWNLFNGITLCDSCHILIDKQRKRFVGVK